MLCFEDNPVSKIGVRFDKPIPDGVDLGGACEGGQGFFCNGNILLISYNIYMYRFSLVLYHSISCS